MISNDEDNDSETESFNLDNQGNLISKNDTSDTNDTNNTNDINDTNDILPEKNSAQFLISPPNLWSSNSSLNVLSTSIKPPPQKSLKVKLEPGHSPLDWARLQKSGTDLRGGVTSLLRISPSELLQHKNKDNIWAAFHGKVYNLTPYLKFHPGGINELLRIAGRDGTKLFMKTHSWVNIEYMLSECMVGILISESKVKSNLLDQDQDRNQNQNQNLDT